MTTYLLDTYAILEMIKGKPSYNNFTEVDFRTTIFNLYELYYNLLKDYSEDMAKSYFKKYHPFLVEIKEEHIFLAAKFKLVNNKRGISYVDALGYEIAKAEGYRFLTGDKEFEKFDNVEFVK